MFKPKPRNKFGNFCFLFLIVLLSIPGFSFAQESYDNNRHQRLYELTKKVHQNGALEFKEGVAITEKEIVSLLSEGDYSFELVRENQSLHSKSITFKKYQEFYKGYKVEGAAFTLKMNENEMVEVFTPKLKFNLEDVAISGSSVEELKSRFKVENSYLEEVVISNKYSEDYREIFIYFINDNYTAVQYFRDARSGQILKEFADKMEIDGTTFHYGVRPMADSQNGGVTSLRTADGSLNIYEGGPYTEPLPTPIPAGEWEIADIPTTTSTTTWDADATVVSRQTSFTASRCLPEFGNAGITFGDVHISTNNNTGAFAYRGSTTADARVNIGVRCTPDNPVSVYDIMAHELAHCYLLQFLQYTNANANAALHEGIADIFGSYIEDFIIGTDWVTGGDAACLAAIYNRDQRDQVCFTTIAGSGQHQVGRVISHWYFAISTGIPADDISAIGMQTGMEIIIEALNNLGNEFAGFPEMRTETIMAAELMFGICSDEYQAVVNAWDRVCVFGTSETCPCDDYDAPELFSDAATNDCPELTVDLDDLHAGSIPNGGQLVWSEDDDSSNGVDVLPSSVVSHAGTYYAYYYNADADCFGPVSIGVEIKIDECCTDPIPDYLIVDENGNPKTDFCVGDDVFLNGCISIDATRFFVGIWEYELGGFAAGDDHVGYSRTDPFWIDNEPGCMMSLDDIWANFRDYEFRAGHEYRIQFAVDNECTTSWHVKEDGIFTMAHPTPDYQYVDANGNPKTVFCIGEDVFLDGSGSVDEDRFFLSIWQYNIGGFAAGEDNLGYSRLDPSWAQGEVGSLINLNEIWANFEQDFFAPGFEYRVQLAVQGECDPTGWNVKEDELFIVICCDGPATCDADFTVSTEEDGDGNIIFNFNNSDEIFFEHTWTVFQHDAQGTGPYTQVAQSNDPHFEFVGEIGGCYTIVHEVETPCGNCCYSREICNEKEGKSLIVANGFGDCDLLCKLTTPTGLTCGVDEKGYLTLSWDDVPGATGYGVTLNFFDPECCGEEGKESKPYHIKTETNKVTLEFYPLCMSWTVTAKCEKERGETSEKACFNYKDDCKGKDGPALKPISLRGLWESESGMSVYPNPTSGSINYSIQLNETDKIEQVTIVDLAGKVVGEIFVDQSGNREIIGSHVFDEELSGVYFLRVQLDSKVITKKIMILK